MDIILVRHGLSEANIEGIYGKDDTPLSKEGRDSLIYTKEKLKDFSYNKIYSSPLKRAVESSKALGIDNPILDNRLKEMDFGFFKGMKISWVNKEYPDDMRKWKSNDPEYIVPGGENREIVYKRVKDFLEEKVRENEDILIISHEGVIKLAFCWVLDNIDYYYNFKIENASINLIRVENNRKIIMKENLI